MKQLEEIQEMLLSEIFQNLDEIKHGLYLDYYNEILGDTSFLLAGFLEIQLKNKFDDWDSEKWIDDSLLTKVKLEGSKLMIWGIMIWGRENVTEQWTDPFYFEFTLDQKVKKFANYNLLFCDSKIPEITYEEFTQNRSFWDKDYYLNNEWNPYERSWRYKISCYGT